MGQKLVGRSVTGAPGRTVALRASGPLRGLLCVLLLCALSACGGNARAPIEDRHAKSRVHTTSAAYRVQRGDTLYSIAFRYGLDYRKVAAANGIPAPYTIYPGQRLFLRESVPLAAKPAPAAPVTPGLRVVVPHSVPLPGASPAATAPAPATPAAAGAAAHTATRPPPANSATAPAAPVPAPVAKPVPAPKSASTPAQPAPAQPMPVAAAAPSPVITSNPLGTYTGREVTAWRWPSAGRVVRGYSTTVHKGIDIDGRRGDAVNAVADGIVVYAGTGIVGFGELLIVKHNEVYLSAYGHNERLLVAEGTIVSAGQQIATKGSSGTDRVQLHFEIRRAGKPIDPQTLLPRR